MTRLVVLLAIFLAITTTACGSTVKTLDIKQNPHPKMRYQITLTIHDAPGQFESVTGHVQYAITNERCAPENPVAGVYLPPPNQYIPFVVTQVADNTYTGTVYLDLLQDEDYFGKGVCHWALAHAGMDLKAKETAFGTSISLRDIVAQKPSTEYLSRTTYFDTLPADRRETGIPVGTPASEYAHKNPQRFFSATLTAKEHLE
ncbi:hypothetical protein QTI24_07600 [Variovorax sp. J22P240]|uniref:hypothetical protein n=1 Tax=Variovorax sp. J22P240 TaxID=3053514 RepID=UPI0025761694|nr:hypothetical protein [Variovorax sp. J22P240]MDL9998458.1 hypothetical protein [Variovorax sp. J22P240]